MAKYLEYNGLSYFWSKLKDFFAKKTEVLMLTGGTLTGPLNGTTATFSGDISGDNAVFTGDINGDNADFGGNVNADGNIVSLGEVEAQERLVVNANEENYGAIRFNSENAAYDGVRFYGNSVDAYGDEIVVGAGGMLIAGSGESAYNLHNALIDAGEHPGNEQSYIASDGHLYLFSHCNTIENRTQLLLYNSNAVQLYGKCGADHAVSIGPSANNGVTTTTDIGGLVFQDKNGTWGSSIGSEINGSAGTVRTYFGLHNVKTDGTNVSQWFCIDLKKDGTIAYSIPYYANFRSAIWAACKPTQLYNNTSGSNGTITLSSSAANYNHLRIYYLDNEGNKWNSSVDVYSPNGKYVALGWTVATDAHVWAGGRVVYISGTSISTYSSYYGTTHADGNWGFGHTNYCAIVRVEGWNE